uniref:Chitinase 3 n=1 Tax=Hypocrella siamensis TaxID=696354 RepID=A0A0P0BUK0_9HYPO|nr:chitinase 3 [Hypocrella siamensis]
MPLEGLRLDGRVLHLVESDRRQLRSMRHTIRRLWQSEQAVLRRRQRTAAQCGMLRIVGEHSGLPERRSRGSGLDPRSFQIAPMDANAASLYSRFTALKSKKAGLETWISIGGWSFTDPGATRTIFSDMASSASGRSTFINGLVQFMSTYGFDGVDIDWNIPVLMIAADVRTMVRIILTQPSISCGVHEQRADAEQGTANNIANTVCYTARCGESCKPGTAEVAQFNGQPGSLSTNDKCDKKQYRSTCCDSKSEVGTCRWRGYRGAGLSCIGGYAEGKTELTTNTNSHEKKGDKNCHGGTQSYCCANFKPDTSNLKTDLKDAAQAAAKAAAAQVALDIAAKAFCRLAVPALLTPLELIEAAVLHRGRNLGYCGNRSHPGPN